MLIGRNIDICVLLNLMHLKLRGLIAEFRASFIVVGVDVTGIVRLFEFAQTLPLVGVVVY